MGSAIRHLLLVVLLLLTQAAALTHGVSHLPDQMHDDEPVCEQCLAYAPISAGLLSEWPNWHVETRTPVFERPVPVATPTVFRAIYQSRAPPLNF